MRRTTDDEQKMTYLARVLRERGTKRTWVADQMGVARSTVTVWCQRGVPEKYIRPLAKLLKVRQKDLRGES